MKKPVPLSSNLVAIKGSAVPAADMPPRSPAMEQPARTGDTSSLPLNFRVPAEFRTTFKTYAAAHNLKLNALLKLSFEAYRKQHGD
jgi:hypothetical protein